MNFSDTAPQQSPLLCSLISVRTASIAGVLNTPGYIFHNTLSMVVNLLCQNTFLAVCQTKRKSSRSEPLTCGTSLFFGWFYDKVQVLISKTTASETNKSKRMNKSKVSPWVYVHGTLLNSTPVCASLTIKKASWRVSSAQDKACSLHNFTVIYIKEYKCQTPSASSCIIQGWDLHLIRQCIQKGKKQGSGEILWGLLL